MRNITPGSIHHIFNRSVLKIEIFKDPSDYIRFMFKMFEFMKIYGLQIRTFCLMPNHFHFILQEPDDGKRNDQIIVAARFMQRLQNSYARYFAVKYKHSGRLFQGNYKNVLIKDNKQLILTTQYIHENPVKKKLVSDAHFWPYSSASVYRLQK
jgi:putative transposase